MNKFIVLSSVVFVLSACQSHDFIAPDSSKFANYLDLSMESQQSQLGNYWQVVSRVAPAYPIDAAKKGLSGCTELIAAINPDGSVSVYKVVKSYPEGVFDLKSAESLKQWRYAPTDTNKNSQPVLTTIQLDYWMENTRNKAEASENCGITHEIS